MKNYYEILEVNRKASKEIIEKAYRVLAKKYHPDQFLSEKKKFAEKKMQEINEAYEVLTDEFLKEQYDTELEKEIEKFYTKKYQKDENFNGNETQMDNEVSENENIVRKHENKGARRKNKSKVGTFAGLVELTKELYSSRPKREEFKEMTKKDAIAIVLTIIVVLLIGVILWFIPFTNGWMRELLFENPLFNWIGSLFGK